VSHDLLDSLCKSLQVRFIVFLQTQHYFEREYCYLGLRQLCSIFRSRFPREQINELETVLSGQEFKKYYLQHLMVSFRLFPKWQLLLRFAVMTC
jgi:hypothetical protein